MVFEIAFPAEKSASVLIDILHGPWPDALNAEDPVLFLSWQVGAFGRFASPGCLERALHECRIWPEAENAVKQHTVVLRLRVRSQQRPETYEGPDREKGFSELTIRLTLPMREKGRPGTAFSPTSSPTVQTVRVSGQKETLPI